MDIRAELCQEIEETWVAFQRLLAEIPEQAYDLPSENPAWTIGEVLYHMSVAPRFLSRDIGLIRSQSSVVQAVIRHIPRSLFDWLNKHLTRWGARNASREFLSSQYDYAHLATIKALNSIQAHEWVLQLNYPDWDPLLSGTVTLERLFRYVKLHFESHAAEIRRVLAL